jgi:hypothetical protein
MEEIPILVGVGLGLITGIYVNIGFDLRTRRGWLIILLGFISGFLLGFSPGNVGRGIGTGIILALLTTLTGPAMSRINRNRNPFKE